MIGRKKNKETQESKPTLNESKGTFVPSSNAEPPPMPTSLLEKHQTKVAPPEPPTGMDLFNAAFVLATKALSVSKQNDFKAIALSYGDLQLISEALNKAAHIAINYSNFTANQAVKDLALKTQVDQTKTKFDSYCTETLELLTGLETLAQKLIK